MQRRPADDLAKMQRLFEDAGLTAPPVPPALRPLVRERAEWVFATREVDPMAMYMFRESLAAMTTELTDPFMAVCHAGHGVNELVQHQLPALSWSTTPNSAGKDLFHW